MIEKIEKLSKGIFDYEQPEITLSAEVLNIFIGSGEVSTGSFVISNAERRVMKGLLYSSSRKLNLEKTSFYGTDNEIFYNVSGTGLEVGERIEGRIDIVSDCGEKQLPFTISVLASTCQSSIGHIKNFFSFQSLAQSAWNEALELFDKKEFYETVIKNEPELKGVYDALRHSPDRNIALEEFLCSMKKKAECSFSVGLPEINLECSYESFMEKIPINKNSWGYLKLTVESDASYILIAKNTIDNTDFVNGKFDLRVVCNMEEVPTGVHYANISIYNAKKRYNIPVRIHVRGGEENQRIRRLSVKKHIVKLIELYIEHKCEHVSQAAYISESIKLTEALLMLLDRVISECRNDAVLSAKYIDLKEQFELYRAYLSIIEGRQFRHDELVSTVLLRRTAYEKKGHYLYPAILFLEALRNNDYESSELALKMIKNAREHEPINSILFLMELKLENRKANFPDLAYKRAMEMIDKGSKSPLVLLEAAIALANDPGLMTKVGFAECYVFHFMQDYGLLTMANQTEFASVIANKAELSKAELYMLRDLYRLFKDREILRIICEKLIRRGDTSACYHFYFKEAVAMQLNLDKLFEYYMYTFGNDYTKSIDLAVLLYFGYNEYLPEEKLAVLYANVIYNKESNPQIYANYRKAILDFAVARLRERKVNTALAVIYEEMLCKDILDEELAETVPDVIFSYRISVTSPLMKRVVVTNSKEMFEAVYSVENGFADVLLYTDSSLCWLEDTEGNRYLVLDEKDRIPYITDKDLISYCYRLGRTNHRLLLYMWENNHMYIDTKEEFLDLQRQISLLTTLKPEVSNECNFMLAQYYYDHYEGELLESYLNVVDLKLLKVKERTEAVELMIVRDMYEKVIEYVNEYGCELLSVKRLSRLCLHGIEAGLEKTSKESLTAMCHMAFRYGATETELIRYLANNFSGTTLEMYEIWNAASAASIDTLGLEENLLAQMLFAESYVENGYDVFVNYYFKNNSNRKLVRAYISYTAYKYFVRGRVINSEFFEILKAEPSLENSLIGILALLKHYSEKDWLTEEEKEFADDHIRKLHQDKKFFAFFKDFKGKLPLPESVLDKCYVEYRTNPGKQVVIHYSYNTDEKFKAENMTDMGYGLFTKEVILFHGETLQYFISEISDGEEEITVSQSLTFFEDDSINSDSRYGEINSILAAVEMRDNKSTAEYLEKYFLNEYAIKRHFKPL